MILDANLQFADGQAVTATAVSEYTLDLGDPAPDLGGGADEIAEARVGAAFETCDSVTVSLEDSANNSSFATLKTGATVLVANLTAGAVIFRELIPKNHRRYLRLKFTVAGSNATAGTVDAHVTTTPQTA